MAIQLGGGLGMQFSGRRGQKDVMPLKPIENDLPVPVQDQLRLGLFHLLEEQEDYLICKGYDPNGANSAHRTINVAKPWLLQKTVWDGQTVPLIVDGELTDVTFEYTDIGKRIARATIVTTNDDGEQEEEEVEETQRITMDYFAGDMILAVQVKHSAALEGVSIISRRLSWLDINMSGRCWAVSNDEDE